MKKNLIAFLWMALSTCSVLAHGGVELGPNKGRVIELSKNETMHGEVVLKGDKFHISLLDKDLKPVAVSDQNLEALTGDRKNPTKLTVQKEGNTFVVPVIKNGDWLIVQYKDTPKSKTITARFKFDTAICECEKPEWLCECKD